MLYLIAFAAAAAYLGKKKPAAPAPAGSVDAGAQRVVAGGGGMMPGETRPRLTVPDGDFPPRYDFGSAPAVPLPPPPVVLTPEEIAAQEADAAALDPYRVWPVQRSQMVHSPDVPWIE